MVLFFTVAGVGNLRIRRMDLVVQVVVRVDPVDLVAVAFGRLVVADSLGRAEPEGIDPEAALADSLADGIRAEDIGHPAGHRVVRRVVVAVDRTVG